MIGVIGGVGFFEADILKTADVEKIDTPYGAAQMLATDKLVFIPRHGINSKVPPHKINHHANIFAFKEKGITKILGVNSVGSLKKEISPPSILIPHDYISLWNIATYYDDKIVHIVPGLDERLRQSLLSLAQNYGLEVVEKGVYIQTLGPRLETKAEIHMLKNFGDVVGMTMANEATLANELGLGYTSLCSVDNYAHGLVDEPLTSETIIGNARMNSRRIRDFILKIAGELE
ncbi:MAG: MTAP family purine nucleoside phosphorylase [Thermoplasmata archaeon]